MPVEDLPSKVILTDPLDPNTNLTILKYGATIISWKNHGQEQLWLSEEARLDGSKPVRGGIPLVFPIFGKQKDPKHPTASLPQHGFARSSTWEFLGQTMESPVTVQFGLGPEHLSKEMATAWPFDFTLILTITLKENSLVTNISVANEGAPFEFNWLFHTYYRLNDITDTLVNNLVDQTCYDQLLTTSYIEKAPAISFHEEFDRVYSQINPARTIQIIDKGKVLFNLHRDGLPDCVVWNPWAKKSAAMADFMPKSAFHQMLCVEPGYVHSMITLMPGEKWVAEQEIELGGEIKIQANIY
ncbi:YMR099C [Candida oxycetoniae]|uniref:Glucose-6-phosphate 1-epimerase n=1 Tax=Candida oxycetoniae TaxID=497107 RepID=A0AAI9WWL4_9ASCO|nr:YMR099C [Candida oxycetoniae]KAI3403356.2 YMR099C [Candida oxycetoniae]